MIQYKAGHLLHSLSHSIIWQNTFKTKAKEMKENDIYWFMFTEGLIQVLLQVISWLNRYCGRISKPYFWQPGNVYFMCNITVYVYCVYLYVILYTPSSEVLVLLWPNSFLWLLLQTSAALLFCEQWRCRLCLWTQMHLWVCEQHHFPFSVSRIICWMV